MKQVMMSALAAAVLAGGAHAQVVINEVFENPPGSGSSSDNRLEFIELYGKPGMSLDGYVIGLLKGGVDEDGDDIPGPLPSDLDPGDDTPEIDECFRLDGHSLGANGLLVLYNNAGFNSFVPGFADPDTALVTFDSAAVPTVDEPGRLGNDTSSTYVLLRNPADDPRTIGFHPFFGGGTGIAPNSWRKDVVQDVDYDGKTDYGTETPVGPILPLQATAFVLDPYQMVDDVAWSNAGGKEYVRDSEQEFSDTPGFNPDAVSRLEYYGTNPMRGHRFNSSGVVVPTRTADEEFIYGDILNAPLVQDRIVYNDAETGAPTDLAAPGYDGSCDPIDDPICTATGGPFLFDDIDTTGFRVTPGAFNDVGGIAQFRFVEGDINFDGVLDGADGSLANTLLGAGPEDLEPCVDEMGMPITDIMGDPVDCYVYQGRGYNTLITLMCLAPDDGPKGTNAPVVTQADLDFFTPACPGDVNTTGTTNGQPDGQTNLSDLQFFLTNYQNDLGVTPGSIADVNTTGTTNGMPDGEVNLSDLQFYLTQWQTGLGLCP